jgi:hypothetical protein
MVSSFPQISQSIPSAKKNNGLGLAALPGVRAKALVRNPVITQGRRLPVSFSRFRPEST